MSEWKPIETMPEFITVLVAAAPDPERSRIDWRYGIVLKSAGLLWEWGWGFPPTHWMPLPAPPTLNDETRAR